MNDVSKIVSDIIDDVIKRGDDALFEYCKKFDGADLTSFEVTDDEINEAFSSVDERFIEILKKCVLTI